MECALKSHVQLKAQNSRGKCYWENVETPGSAPYWRKQVLGCHGRVYSSFGPLDFFPLSFPVAKAKASFLCSGLLLTPIFLLAPKQWSQQQTWTCETWAQANLASFKLFFLGISVAGIENWQCWYSPYSPSNLGPNSRPCACYTTVLPATLLDFSF